MEIKSPDISLSAPLLIEENKVESGTQTTPTRRRPGVQDHKHGDVVTSKSGGARQWLPAVAVPIRPPYALGVSVILLFIATFLLSIFLYKEIHKYHCAHSVPSIDAHITPQLVYVLGAQVISDGSGGAIIPALHTLSRSQAAAMVMSRLGLRHVIISGGYNVGVRYELTNNTILQPANFSFEAVANARTLGPSESEVMKAHMVANWSVSPYHVLTEEVSATTDENAIFGHSIIDRSNFLPSNWSGAPIRIGVLTNLWHMPRALISFQNGFALGNTRVILVPVFAEDYCVFASSERHIDWSLDMERYYSTPKGGVLYNATLIGNIMRARLAGSNSSVGSLIGY
jgi:uncharacterized SAM-binding protein YcdF (DUF218 family)